MTENSAKLLKSEFYWNVQNIFVILFLASRRRKRRVQETCDYFSPRYCPPCCLFIRRLSI